MAFRRGWLGTAVVVLGSSAGLIAAPPIVAVPGKSLPADAGPARVGRSFAAGGVRTVVLRALGAEGAEVVTVPGSRVVTVSGVPAGGAKGYHPADPNWRETPAPAWGLDFRATAFGPALVVSSKNEILYIHHDYHLDRLRVVVPPGVDVVKENREPSGDGTPDLAEPVAKPGRVGG